jgi:flagellin-like hook-associated protein FlgL
MAPTEAPETAMPQLQTQLNARSADFQANAAAAGAILLGMSSRPAAALAPASQIRIAVALVALGATLGGCSATSDQTPVTLPAAEQLACIRITGGGAMFQLGPEVVSNQQARLGIMAVSTGKLGGVSGRLYQLGSGESLSLKNDAAGASRVIEETIEKVSSLRGRLGAFQRTTLDSNSISLSDTLSNLTDAESSIRDADFAKESAALTRAQILVQSGTSVLGIANQSSQSVLSLLRQ